MASTTLGSAKSSFKKELARSRNLAAKAKKLPDALREPLAETLFLTAFCAWEQFLERCFVLYLAGSHSPSGFAPSRYYFPPSRKRAEEWIVPEGRVHTDWNKPATLVSRAERHFRKGAPFAAALQAFRNALEVDLVVRNSVAHRSAQARRKFESIARQQLGGTLPARLTVGEFLDRTLPGSKPPSSYLEQFLGRLRDCADQIVPG